MVKILLCLVFVYGLRFSASSQNNILCSKVSSYVASKKVDVFSSLIKARATEPKEILPFPGLQSTNPLGYFCKVELQIEKQTRIPIRFRLGSVDYTNSLEHGIK